MFDFVFFNFYFSKRIYFFADSATYRYFCTLRSFALPLLIDITRMHLYVCLILLHYYCQLIHNLSLSHVQNRAWFCEQFAYSALFFILAFAIYLYVFQNKCEYYWSQTGSSISHKNLVIKGKSEEKIGGIVKRTFVVNNLDTQVLNINYYHLDLYLLIYLFCTYLVRYIFDKFWKLLYYLA